jgi:hypothetical protein
MIAQPPSPEYRGIPYQIMADFRVTSMGQTFESLVVFRKWVRPMPATLTPSR